MSKIKILFVAANPSDTGRLALDKEHREITAEIRAAAHRDAVEVVFAGAVRPSDLLRLLNEHQPNVVHFSGHGGPNEILLLGDDDKAKPASAEALTRLFAAVRPNLRLVFLNACYSLPQAEGIVQAIDCAIGVGQEIRDVVAIRFAAAFYRAIAYGQDVQNAYEQARVAVELDGIPSEQLPRLVFRPEVVDPNEVVLVQPTLDDESAEHRPILRPLEHRDFLAPNFTGRRQELAKLEDEIREHLDDGTALGFWGFRGTGGVGKSALTAQLAEQLAADPLLFPGGVLWVDFVKYGEQPHETAARWLRAYDPRLDTSQLAPHEGLSQFRDLARARQPLIVLDNVQCPEQVELLMVRGPGVVTLITTRDLRNIPPDINSRTVEQLSEADSLDLLASFAGEAVAAEPQAAKQICEQCGHLPVFLKAAAAACRSLKYRTLREYAQELARRGLESLADHDHKAATVFDLSWEPLNAHQQEAAAVLSQCPGPDCGANVLEAWFGIDRQQAWAILSELEENAALITLAGDDRFRMHDRVRDYVESKLGHENDLISQTEILESLLSCWTFWDLVNSELAAVGAYELARQYHVLRQRRLEFADDLPSSDADDFDAWYRFIRGQAHVLARWPELLFQQAYNESVGSPVAAAAGRAASQGKAAPRWLEWTNRAVQYVPPACLQILSGHEDVVTSVAWNCNPRYVVSGSWDETVRVWDLESGQCAGVLPAGSCVSSVAVTPDGQIIAGGFDGLIRIWEPGPENAGTWCREPVLLEGHTGAVQCLAADARGDRLVSAAFDHTIRVWDLRTRQSTAVFAMFAEHTSDVLSLAISPDGHRALCGLLDGTLLAWDLRSSTSTAVLRGHTAGVQSVAFSRDGRRAVSGAWDKTIRLWDVETGECLRLLLGHHTHAVSIAMTADGGRAVSGGWGQTVRVWDLEAAQCLTILEGHSAAVAGVALSPDERYAVSGSFDGTLRVWDVRHAVETGRLVHGDALELSPQPPPIHETDDADVRSHEGFPDDDGACSEPLTDLFTFPGGRHASYISSVGFLADGVSAISCSGDETMRVWHVATGRCLDTLPVHSDVALHLQSSANNGGPYRAVLERDVLLLRDVEFGDVVARFPGQYTAAACSLDGRCTIAGTGNGRVYLLKLCTRG